MSDGKSLLPAATTTTAAGGAAQARFYYKNLHLDTHQANRVNLEQCSDEHEQAQSAGSSQRTTDAQTMMHILKANIGTGVLAMPLAFKNVGLWLGLIFVPAIGAICIHCMNILIASHNRLCDRFNFESLDYDQVAGLGLACGPKWARRFAKRAHIIVSIFLMFTQIGFCCVYTLFTVENLQVAMLNLFSLDYSTTTYLVAVFPVIGLTSCTSNLKHLARISTLANCLQLFGLSLIFFDLLQFHTYSEHALKPVPTDEDIIALGAQDQQQQQQVSIQVEQGISANILNGLPLFFATAVYAFEGIGVVLPLVKEMERPERISGANGVLNTSMSMVAVLYMAVGFFGYAKYGQTVSGSITLNLPESTLNELVRLAFALAIGLSYSLQFYVPWTIVWPLIDESLFYSYRPRVPRDKLDILRKLNKDNHWAITGQAIEEHQREQALRRQQHERQLQLQQQHESGQPADKSVQQQQQQQQQPAAATIAAPEHEAADQESTASTLATSYTMSTSCRWPAHGLQSSGAARSASVRQRVLHAAAASTYGTIETAASLGPVAFRRTAKLRNRLEDVMEREAMPSNRNRNFNNNTNNNNDSGDDDDDDDDSMPEVHWRPPPRSMRGKRKLVRYTVILLTVSFTFIAAALIPRLDLFISLIGALASSCLAIIFPAIIQLCTFWNYNEEDQNEEELGRAADQATLESERLKRKVEQELRGARKRKAAPGKRLNKVRRIKWCLFVVKNCLLVLFGVLGLITGSWVSLAQLGVAGVHV